MSIAAVVLIAASVLVVRQWNNVKALQYAGMYSREELADQKQQNEERIQQAVEGTQGLQVRDLTPEEREALQSGNLSQEELVQILTGKKPEKSDEPVEPPPHAEGEEPPTEPAADATVAPSPEEPAASEEPVPSEEPTASEEPIPSEEPTASEEPIPSEEPTASVEPTPTESIVPTPVDEPAAPTVEATEPPVELSDPPGEEEASYYETRLSELIAEVYILRADMLNSIDDMVSEARRDYLSLEDKSKAARSELMLSYVRKAEALEAECDAKMDQIVDEVRVLVEEYGGDPTLYETIEDTYFHEKIITKAAYLQEFDAYL